MLAIAARPRPCRSRHSPCPSPGVAGLALVGLPVAQVSGRSQTPRMVTRCQPSSYSPRITRLRRRPQHTHAAHQVPVRPAQVITGSRSHPAATNHQAIRRNSKAPGLRPVVMMREQARRRVVRGAVGLPIIAHRPEHHSAMPKVVRPPRRMGMPINACACMAPARRALCTSARQGSYQRGQIADSERLAGVSAALVISRRSCAYVSDGAVGRPCSLLASAAFAPAACPGRGQRRLFRARVVYPCGIRAWQYERAHSEAG